MYYKAKFTGTIIASNISLNGLTFYLFGWVSKMNAVQKSEVKIWTKQLQDSAKLAKNIIYYNKGTVESWSSKAIKT